MNAIAGAVRERPILFSDEMVRALLDGRKTQTRRVVKIGGVERPELIQLWVPRTGDPAHARFDGENRTTRVVACPYGAPGDRLYVREAHHVTTAQHVVFRADYPACAESQRLENIPPVEDVCWVPSIHMPRWTSRLTLEITDVRVERVQDISEEDASAEGVEVDMLCDLLSAAASRAKDLPPLHWIGGTDSDDGDLCRPCAAKRLRALVRAGGDKEELFIDGGCGYEADSHRFCELCGQQLDVSLTDYGTKEEVAHFAEAGIVSPDDARDFLDMLDCGNPRLTKACGGFHLMPELAGPIARIGYRYLWDQLNAARGFGWDVNPWVWAITFRVVPAHG